MGVRILRVGNGNSKMFHFIPERPQIRHLSQYLCSFSGYHSQPICNTSLPLATMSSSAVCSIPKLTYFDVAGRVFALRIAMFKAFGKDGWVDDRIQFQEWAALKPTTPLGTLPVLTLADGTTTRVQTDALTRWAGSKANLYGSTDDEKLVIDEVISTSFEALNKTPKADTEDEKKKLREEYAAGFLSQALGLLEKRVEASNTAGTGPWVAGGDITIGDLTLTTLTGMIVDGQFDHVPASLVLEKFPLLEAHRTSVMAHSIVKDYLANYLN